MPFSVDDAAVWMLYITCERSAMMNAGQKRASFFATPVFAEIRQATNELEEARHYSILADGIQQDRCFLLLSYESVFLAHPIRALDVDDADVEKNVKTIAVQNENPPASISI
jgi:hypothetical protein